MQDFQENYSIEKLNGLSVNDYVLGTDNKESLCYKIEFGKYRWAGPGIGGSTAYKYGIYFSKDKNEYRSAEHGYEPNPDEQFNKIKADVNLLFIQVRTLTLSESDSVIRVILISSIIQSKRSAIKTILLLSNLDISNPPFYF